ncbi:MAG: hypothetical protein GZ094_24955 [Mariniphaga sp.]|nr:hypothetical protein [Mariniphaga sp.]
MEKLTLKELGISYQLLAAAEANGLKGGTTPDEMYAAVDAGTWKGGNVDGMGYVAEAVTCTYYQGTDQWQSTINVPSGGNYQPDRIGDAINNANRNQPSQTGDDTVVTPFGEWLTRWLLENLSGSK